MEIESVLPVIQEVKEKSPYKGKKRGRKHLYAEKTETFSIAIPKSKKRKVKELVVGFLKQYRID